MNNAHIQFGSSVVSLEDFQELPEKYAHTVLLARNTAGHALCLCTPSHPKLVIAKRANRFYVAGWPNEGHRHDFACVFHKAVPGTSGLDSFSKEALQIGENGQFSIKIKDPLSIEVATAPKQKHSSREKERSPSVTRRSSTLLGLLHYLWEEASLNRWHPAWTRDWFIASTKEINPHGQIASICIVTVNGGSGCDAPEHVLTSGVSLRAWTGGNAPINEDLLFTDTNSQSGWTVAAFMIVAIAVGAISGGAAFAAFAGAEGTLALPLYGIATSALETGAIIGAVGGSVYGTSAFAVQGANSFTQVQAEAFGSVQNGVSTPQAPSNEYLQRLVTLTETRQIVADFGASLGSNKRVLFGDCPAYVAASSCAASGLDPGTLPRPDTLKEADNMKSVYLRYLYCRDNIGLSGSQLQKCAAPILDINDPTTVYYSTPDFN